MRIPPCPILGRFVDRWASGNQIDKANASKLVVPGECAPITLTRVLILLDWRLRLAAPRRLLAAAEITESEQRRASYETAAKRLAALTLPIGRGAYVPRKAHREAAEAASAAAAAEAASAAASAALAAAMAASASASSAAASAAASAASAAASAAEAEAAEASVSAAGAEAAFFEVYRKRTYWWSGRWLLAYELRASGHTSKESILAAMEPTLTILREGAIDAYWRAAFGPQIVEAAIRRGVAEDFVQSLGPTLLQRVAEEDQVRLDHAIEKAP